MTKCHLPYLLMVLSRLSDAFQMASNLHSFSVNTYLHSTSEYLLNAHRPFQKSCPPGTAPRYHDQATDWLCLYGGWILKTQEKFINKVNVAEDSSEILDLHDPMDDVVDLQAQVVHTPNHDSTNTGEL